MWRREFITLIGSADASASCCKGSDLAQGASRWTGVRNSTTDSPQYVAIDNRLRELGCVDGQNLALEFFNVEGHYERYDEAMKEPVRRNVDIIIALGPEPALKAARAATSTLPIVMIAIDYDPFALGYAASLARPGGNITGVFFQQIELVGKRLQLVKDAFPDLQALTVFWDSVSADQWRAVQISAATLGLRVEGVALNEHRMTTSAP
jgi:putative tryptophan/tyrosine transport system substrate-binding protein